MPQATDEDSFLLALRDLLRSGDVPDDVRRQAEEIQMSMASPGDWASAPHKEPDSPEA